MAAFIYSSSIQSYFFTLLLLKLTIANMLKLVAQLAGKDTSVRKDIKNKKCDWENHKRLLSMIIMVINISL